MNYMYMYMYVSFGLWYSQLEHTLYWSTYEHAGCVCVCVLDDCPLTLSVFWYRCTCVTIVYSCIRYRTTVHADLYIVHVHVVEVHTCTCTCISTLWFYRSLFTVCRFICMHVHCALCVKISEYYLYMYICLTLLASFFHLSLKHVQCTCTLFVIKY